MKKLIQILKNASKIFRYATVISNIVAGLGVVEKTLTALIDELEKAEKKEQADSLRVVLDFVTATKEVLVRFIEIFGIVSPMVVKDGKIQTPVLAEYTESLKKFVAEEKK